MPVKISGLTAGGALTGAEKVPAVQSGNTVYSLVSQIGTYVRGLFTTTPATIAEGGTGAATATTARTALGATAGVWGIPLGGTGATTAAAARTAIGAVGLTGAELIAGAKLFSDLATFTVGAEAVAAPLSSGSFPRSIDLVGSISGLTYSNNAGDVTNDLDIAVGAAIGSSGAGSLRLPGALTKRSDAAWAAGTNAGMLDTGAVGNSDYFLWIIGQTSGAEIDILSSLSATAPTMPATYNRARLFGWFRRLAGAIVAFHTYELTGGGLRFAWDAPVIDATLTNTLTTSRHLDVLSVPLGLQVEADLNINSTDASAAYLITCRCPDETDAAPSVSASPGVDLYSTGTVAQYANLRVLTNTSGQVASRSTVATIDTYRLITKGFIWSRR